MFADQPADLLDRAPPTAGPHDRSTSLPLDGEPSTGALRVALLNVKYSPNLGDGLLSECLERELAAARPGTVAWSVDLAGRKGFSAVDAAAATRRRWSWRGAALAVLDHLPTAVRALVALAGLMLVTRLRLAGHVRRRVAGASAVVVGGGNLLTDADCNFPMKLAAACDVVHGQGLPLAVHAVGAGGGWSRRGRRLFARALARRPLVHAAVRDARSRVAWEAGLTPCGAVPAAIVGDPGLLTSLHYPQPRATPPDSGAATCRIGFCITAPIALRYHTGDAARGAGIVGWYGDVAQALAAAGHDVVLFTNGSPEDRHCLGQHGARWCALAPGHGPGSISVARGFVTPADLAACVAACDLVIAHRMHACIAAHSYAVPTIALAWDRKLDSFMALAGRQHWLIDPATTSAQAMVEHVTAALAQGVDAAALATLIARTRDDVALLAERLAAAAVIA